MRAIQNEQEYRAMLARIEELLPLVNDNTPKNDKNLVELELISDLVIDYEDTHYPTDTPSLTCAMQLRMYEMGLNQTKLAKLLGVSRSRVSEYINGKSEPSLKVAREISRKLNIDADIVLGVQIPLFCELMAAF